MKNKLLFTRRLALAAMAIFMMMPGLGWAADAAGDYRSKATGNWNATATWERFDGTSWVAAVATPTSADGVITIKSPNVVTISATGLSYDQVIVDPGAQVTVAATITHTLANGTGTDLTINGTWLNSGGTWTATGTWAVGSGGTFIHNTTSGISTPLGNATFDPASNFIYRGSSTLTPALSFSGRAYGNLSFESTSGAWAGTLSGATATSVTDFTIGTGITLTTTFTGILTVNGSYTNNGTLTFSTGTQVFTFTGSGKTISGSGTISFETLNINSGASITCSNAVTLLATFTGTVTGSLATAATFTNSGTLNVNGTFQLNSGGWATGTAFVYGAAGTLVFNTTYTANSGAYWPTTSGPVNVTVNTSSPLTMGFARTLTGTLSVSAAVTNATTNTLTVSGGTCQINNTSATFSDPLLYSGNSTLLYNVTGTIARGNEWNNSPSNVTLQATTTLNYPSNWGTFTRTLTGSLTIGIGTALYMDYGSPAAGVGLLTVGGNLVLDGSLSLGNKAGGDLCLKGNYTRTGILTPNGRAVFFQGGNAQTLTGVTTFDYLNMGKSGNDLTIVDNITINQTLTFSDGTNGGNANGGHIITSGATSVTLAAGGSNTGGSATSHVSGKLIQSYTAVGSKTFMIGKGGNYRPLTLNYTALTGTSAVTAEQTEGALPGTIPGATTLFSSRYWTVAQTGGSAFTYKISVDGTGFSPTNTAVLLKGDGISNTAFAATFASPNYTNTADLNTFSNFGLGDMSAPTAYSVTGTGAYCQGGSGLPVGVANSQVGVTYTISPGGTQMAGTGSAISFGTLTAGTYTISGTNLGGTTSMTGSAVITEEATPVAGTLAKTPNTASVLTGTNVSAALTAGSGGNGTDELEYRFGGTGSWSSYTTGTNLSTTGQTSVDIRTRRTATVCSPSAYTTESWTVDATTTYTGTGNWSTSGNWSHGIPTSSIDATVNGDVTIDVAAVTNSLSINTGKSVTISSTKSLTVSGTLTNTNDAGLVIKSDGTGTGSLITSSSPHATVERYITGVSNAWHEISSPVTAQAIEPEFVPSLGSTAEDFFTWYETGSVWVNYKNTGTAPTWNTANGSTNFVLGKGYLVAYLATNPTKTFTGTLNSGTINFPMTASGTGTYAKTNLAGNPYPSSIDWKSGAWVKDNIQTDSGGGHNIYTWNETKNNYGAYNDVLASNFGTNGVSRYIAPMQGFIVKAIAAGNLTMTDAMRVHSSQTWLKSGDNLGFRLNVTAPGNNGSDEIVLEFGHSTSVGGAAKLYSFVATAPSLSTPKSGTEYSISFLETLTNETVIPVTFKAGIDGQYTLAANLENLPEAHIYLVDNKLSKTQNLSDNPVYTFAASTTDQPSRFKLTFKSVGINETTTPQPFTIYASNNTVYVDNTSTTSVKGEVFVYNTLGQVMAHQNLNGERTKINIAAATGYYLVEVITEKNTFTGKVFVKQQ